MAQATITRACGHLTNENLTGKSTDRDRRAAWLRTQDCPACARAAKTTAATASATATGLPALTGSEKQVAWAITIRAEKLAQATTTIATFTARAEKALSGNELAAAIARADRALAELSAQTEARFWIDNRAEQGGMLAQRFMRA